MSDYRPAGRKNGNGKGNGVASRDAVGIYLRDIRRFDLLDREEEARIAWRVKSGDETARAELISRNLRLVISIAKRYQGMGLSLEDLIEEIYQKEGESKTTRATFKHAKEFKEGLHLFVLVHGFQATHIDMQEIKNHIAMVVPNSVFLCSSSNEGKKTNGSIETMGKNLAEEVFDFFDDEDDVGDQVSKISFIGHSMGGIIIRCALPKLSQFRKMMHGYCSLSSPHLGYASCKSKMVKIGLWAMQAFNKPESIKQLSMGDAKDIKDTFMFKISQYEGMQWFKHIMLFSSVQDGYVTFDSARIQIFKNTTLYDTENQGSDYIEMATNILDS